MSLYDAKDFAKNILSRLRREIPVELLESEYSSELEAVVKKLAGGGSSDGASLTNCAESTSVLIGKSSLVPRHSRHSGDGGDKFIRESIRATMTSSVVAISDL
jgi:hypothetical protein